MIAGIEATEREVEMVRDRSRIYLLPGSIESVVKYTVGSEALTAETYKTIWVDREKVRGKKVTAEGIRRSMRAVEGTYDSKLVKELSTRFESHIDLLYQMTELLLRNYDDAKAFRQNKRIEIASPQDIIEFADIGARGLERIGEFKRKVIGEINFKLQDEIEEARDYSVGYFFERVLPMLKGEGQEKIYKTLWAFLMCDSPAKNFLATMLSIYGENKKAVADGRAVNGCFEIYFNGDTIAPIHADNPPAADDEMHIVDDAFTAMVNNLAKLEDIDAFHRNMERTIASVFGEIIVENRRRRAEGLEHDTEKSSLRSGLEKHTTLNRKALEEAKAQQEIVAQKDVELQRKVVEIKELKARINKTAEKEIGGLERQLAAEEGRNEVLQRDLEIVNGELRAAEEAEEKMGIRLQRYESGVRQDTYRLLVDKLHGTEWGNVAEEVVAAIVGGSKNFMRVGGCGTQRTTLERNARRKLPPQLQSNIPEVLDRLKRVGVYTTTTDGAVWYTTNTGSEVTDQAIKSLVKEIHKLKTEDRLHVF